MQIRQLVWPAAFLILSGISCAGTAVKKTGREPQPFRSWSLAGLHIRAHSTDGYRTVYIDRIPPGLPAANTGLTPGERILGIDSRRDLTVDAYSSYIRSKKPGTLITVYTVNSNGQKRAVVLKTAAFPPKKQLLLLIRRSLDSEDYSRSATLLRYAGRVHDWDSKERQQLDLLRRQHEAAAGALP